VLVPLLLVALGCGKGYQVAPVSGRVTLDNRPLANADVRFIPTTGQDLPYSFGITDEQGHYELRLGVDNREGAVVGEHHVTISMSQAHGKIMPRPGTGNKRLGEFLPSRYNRASTLTCTVPPEGRTDANFDLTNK
jgi:hypothetical protein